MKSKNLKTYASNFQHIGQRENQEDSFAVSNIDDKKQVKQAGILAVVADGMGGLSMGQEASSAAVKTFFTKYFEFSSNLLVQEALLSSLTVANIAVFDLAFQDGVTYDVGTTLSAALVHDSNLYWVSAGDSRIYLFREGELTQLTKDHVYENHLKEEAEKGLISPEEVVSHPEKDYLTSYLGLIELPETDYNEKPFPLMADDIIMICSDGLYNALSEKEIKLILDEKPDNAAEILVNEAISKKIEYQDNVTVITLYCFK